MFWPPANLLGPHWPLGAGRRSPAPWPHTKKTKNEKCLHAVEFTFLAKQFPDCSRSCSWEQSLEIRRQNGTAIADITTAVLRVEPA